MVTTSLILYSYKYNDEEWKKLMKVDDEFFETFSGVFLDDMIPGLHYVWETQKLKRLKDIMKQFLEDYLGKKFQAHKKSFDKGMAG